MIATLLLSFTDFQKNAFPIQKPTRALQQLCATALLGDEYSRLPLTRRAAIEPMHPKTTKPAFPSSLLPSRESRPLWFPLFRRSWCPVAAAPATDAAVVTCNPELTTAAADVVATGLVTRATGFVAADRFVRARADPGFFEGGATQWWKYPPTDDRSRSDRARPEAVLGVGVGGGRPLPQRGSGGVTPGKFFQF